MGSKKIPKWVLPFIVPGFIITTSLIILTELIKGGRDGFMNTETTEMINNVGDKMLTFLLIITNLLFYAGMWKLFL